MNRLYILTSVYQIQTTPHDAYGELDPFNPVNHFDRAGAFEVPPI